ncbi:MAG: hypothetical protein LLG13_00600 [Bacteroidales bacterium]|nr:hypothetical protein [Bacteroidales bacterium]
MSDVDVLLDKAPQDTIEKELMAKIPRSEVYIHAEPQDISHIQTEAEGTTKI